jgi:hypothetical protein
VKIYLFAIVLVIALVGAAIHFSGTTAQATYRSDTLIIPVDFTPKFFDDKKPDACREYGCPHKVEYIGLLLPIAGHSAKEYVPCECDWMQELLDKAEDGLIEFKRNQQYECLFDIHVEKKGYTPGPCPGLVKYMY